jgi:hypothetical protein
MHRVLVFLTLCLGLAWPQFAAARFVSADPVAADAQTGANFNRYAYANGNPYRYVDPDGRWAEDLVLGVPSLVIGARSLYDNVRAGRLGPAVVDALGMAYDAAAIATPAVPGGAGLGIRAGRSLADDALVVRGGSAAGANSAEGLAKGTATHPSGATGFSAESANGMTVCELCANMPVRYSQVGVTTVGQVRQAGGDVVQTGGQSPTHATVTGLTSEAASNLLNPTRPNPIPKEKRP